MNKYKQRNRLTSWQGIPIRFSLRVRVMRSLSKPPISDSNFSTCFPKSFPKSFPTPFKNSGIPTFTAFQNQNEITPPFWDWLKHKKLRLEEITPAIPHLCNSWIWIWWRNLQFQKNNWNSSKMRIIGRLPWGFASKKPYQNWEIRVSDFLLERAKHKP